jgi:polyphosphate kinase 2 (PPK2 family)
VKEEGLRVIVIFEGRDVVMLFDRSWYNRAGVEHVMGVCTEAEYEAFLRVVPAFEREVIDSGIRLIKYFFDVSQDEQERRFLARATGPLRHWKLSPMDVKSWQHWWDYTAAYQRMLEATDTDASPWYRVQADDKQRARLNCISHLLGQIPYPPIEWEMPEVGKRQEAPWYAGRPDVQARGPCDLLDTFAGGAREDHEQGPLRP